MTHQEAELEFNILFNSIASNVAPSVDPYEMSVFMTQALEELVRLLYSTFETDEQSRRYLKELLKQSHFTLAAPYTKTTYTRSNSDLPDVLFIVREWIIPAEGCNKDKKVPVIPITLDEYYKVIGNPFRGLTDRRAIRIEEDKEIVIESKYPIKEYVLDYIKRPGPIILEDLSSNPPVIVAPTPYTSLTIDGLATRLSYTYGTEINQISELHPFLHRKIIEIAVTLAQKAYMASSNS